MGVDTTGVIKTMTDSMNLDLVDCIDFHVYMDSMSNTSLRSEIIDKISSFADSSRGKDWSVLETSGPLLQYPTDSVPDGYEPYTIHQLLVGYVANNEEYWFDDDSTAILEERFINRLYDYTEIVDDEFLLLPENLPYFENYIIEEFQRRVPVFNEAGAEYVHWWSAWRYEPFGYPQYPIWGGCKGCEPQDWNPGKITGRLIKQAKWFPRNILDEDGFPSATPFARTMRAYIEDHPPERRYDGNTPMVTHDAPELPAISNYPNVFNASTRIDYVLPEDGQARLEIYDILGKRVVVLIDEYRKSGNHSIIWDAEDYPSGVYFCRLTQGSHKAAAKMGLVK